MDNKVLNNLLIISSQINYLYDKLIDLSRKDLEDIEEFKNNCNKLKKYYLYEDKIVSKLSTKEINDILSDIDKSIMDNNRNYERIFITLCSRLDYLEDTLEESSILLDECFSSLSFEDDSDEFDNDIILEEIDEEIDEYSDIDNDDNQIFYQEVYDHELDKFRDYELSRIYLLALKDMEKLITNNDDNYSLNLSENLKIFKYNVFEMTKYLEELAINYYFNINNIPNLEKIDNYDYLAIYYNRAFTLIYELNSYSVYDNNIDTLSEVIFLLITFDLLISRLDKNRLIKLKKLCYKLGSDKIEETYLSKCLEKIHTKE